MEFYRSSTESLTNLKEIYGVLYEIKGIPKEIKIESYKEIKGFQRNPIGNQRDS